MKAMTAGIVLSTVALLVQGTRCLLRQGAPPFVRRFGALTLLLAGLSAVLFVLLHFGEAVLSPEFDSVMARGHRRGLAALVLGLALAAEPGAARPAPQDRAVWAPGRPALPRCGGGRPGHDAHHDAEQGRDGGVPDLRVRSLVAAAPPVGQRVLPGRRDHDPGCDRPPGSGRRLRGLARRARVGRAQPVLRRPDVRAPVAVGLPLRRRVERRAFGVLLVRAAPGGARGAWPWLASAPGRAPPRRRANLAGDRGRGLGGRADHGPERVSQGYGRLLVSLRS